MTDRKIRRGEIYYADLPETESGSVQAGRRPVLITQCDRLNRTSTTVLVAIVTSKLKRPDDETHVVLPMMKGLPKQSMVEAEQRKTISKSQLLEYRCTLDHQTMKRVTRALRNSEKEDNTFSQRRHSKKESSSVQITFFSRVCTMDFRKNQR